MFGARSEILSGELDWRPFTVQEEKQVEKDDDPVEDIHILPDLIHFVVTPPDTVLLRVWNICARKILVCSEYYEAERVVLSADGRGVDAFVVSGQPGIDPSPSLAVASGI